MGVAIERRVLKNAGALALARAATAALSLVTFAYLARVLEPERFGLIGVGLALVAYFGLPVDFGLNTLGIRELARAPHRSDELVGAILGLRAVLAVLALGVYAAVVSFLDKPMLFKAVLWIQGAALIAQAISLEWVFQGIERMGLIALRNVVVALLSLAGMVLFVQRPEDVVAAAVVSVFALVAANASLVVTYGRRFGAVRVRMRWSAWAPLLRPALPLWASQLAVTLFVYLDTLLLGLLRGEVEAGWYTAAYKLAAVAFIPSEVLLKAFLPTLAQAHGTLPLMQERGSTFAMALFSLGFPICLGGALLAQDLTVWVYGPDYRTAGMALALLMGNVVLAYGNTAFGQPLVAWNRERAFVVAFGLGVALNVALDLVLIPRFGINGAAASTTAAQGAVLGILAVLHYRLTRQAHLGLVFRVGLASLLGVGGTLVLGAALGWALPVRIGAAMGGYVLVAYGLRLVDFGTLLGSLRRGAA